MNRDQRVAAILGKKDLDPQRAFDLLIQEGYTADYIAFLAATYTETSGLLRKESRPERMVILEEIAEVASLSAEPVEVMDEDDYLDYIDDLLEEGDL